MLAAGRGVDKVPGAAGLLRGVLRSAAPVPLLHLRVRQVRVPLPQGHSALCGRRTLRSAGPLSPTERRRRLRLHRQTTLVFVCHTTKFLLQVGNHKSRIGKKKFKNNRK